MLIAVILLFFFPLCVLGPVVSVIVASFVFCLHSLKWTYSYFQPVVLWPSFLVGLVRAHIFF